MFWPKIHFLCLIGRIWFSRAYGYRHFLNQLCLVQGTQNRYFHRNLKVLLFKQYTLNNILFYTTAHFEKVTAKRNTLLVYKLTKHKYKIRENQLEVLKSGVVFL